MYYKIHNEIFCLSISDLGAELEELCVDNINILWKRGSLWQDQSPILFPIIGKLKDGYYLYDHKKYEMSGHGYLKGLSFEVVEKTETSITLKSSSTPKTLKQYPFQYEFYITYALIANKIKIAFEIKNLEETPMFFSCGLHPGFDLKRLEKLLGNTLYLEFPPVQVPSIQFDPALIKNVTEVELQPRLTMSEFSKELTVSRTICYQGVNQVDLRAQTNILRIKHNMPYTAFWQARPEQPQFLCIEEWSGLPDEVDTNHQLVDKIGIQQIPGKQAVEYEIEISFLEGVK